MTNVEARFNIALHPRKPEGSLGRTARTATSTLTQLLQYGQIRTKEVRVIYSQAPDVTGEGTEGLLFQQFWSSEANVKAVISAVAAGADGVPIVRELDIELCVQQKRFRRSTVCNGNHSEVDF